MLWYLADLCLDSMSIKVCCHIYTFKMAYENINIFLLRDGIWNYWNLYSHIWKKKTLRYFIQIFGIFYTLLTTLKW